jgi:hypothetical protein
MAASIPCAERCRSADDLDEAIVYLTQHLNSSMYRLLELVREFDDRLGWAKWSFQNCSEWLAWRCGLSLSAARAPESIDVARRAWERRSLIMIRDAAAATMTISFVVPIEDGEFFAHRPSAEGSAAPICRSRRSGVSPATLDSSVRKKPKMGPRSTSAAGNAPCRQPSSGPSGHVTADVPSRDVAAPTTSTHTTSGTGPMAAKRASKT